jgi:aromatic ring hydroxylase
MPKRTVDRGGESTRRRRLSSEKSLPMNTPGLKLISGPSYELASAINGSVFDYPLSSRFDENDASIVLDHALIPWKNILIDRDVEKANAFSLTQDGYRASDCTDVLALQSSSTSWRGC